MYNIVKGPTSVCIAKEFVHRISYCHMLMYSWIFLGHVLVHTRVLGLLRAHKEDFTNMDTDKGSLADHF